jgi:sugar phosphate isomerase/epimerase
MLMDVAIRDAMVPGAGTANFFGGLRALGVSAVEVELARDLSTPHVRCPDGSTFQLHAEANLRAFQSALRGAGVRVSALLLATDFTGRGAAEDVEWAGAAVGLAELLGAPAVRIDPLSADKQLPRDTVLTRFAVRVNELMTLTAGRTVDVGIENHGPFANDPAFLDAILAAVDQPRLGLTLDTGNFYWYGFPLESVYGLIERYAPRVKHTHLKSINYPPELAGARREVGVGYRDYCCALDEGNIDLARVVRILRGAGYDRDLCVENESLFKHAPEARGDVLRRDVAALRAAIR